MSQKISQPRPTADFSPAQLRRLHWMAQNRPRWVALFRRVYNGLATPRQAIKAQCLDCVGCEQAAIRECADSACPLRRFRPFQVPTRSAARPGKPKETTP